MITGGLFSEIRLDYVFVSGCERFAVIFLCKNFVSIGRQRRFINYSSRRRLFALSGERPFRCSVCGSCFSTKGNLKVHVAGHSSSVDKFSRPAFTRPPGHVSARTPSRASTAELTGPSSSLGPNAKLAPSSSRYPDPPVGGQASPQSTTSTSAAPTSPKRHCPTGERQTSAANCPSANSDGVDYRTPSISARDKLADGRPAVAERLVAPPCQILASVVPPMYRAPMWLPPGIPFPPYAATTNFRFAAAESQLRSEDLGRRASLLYRAGGGGDPLEQVE